MGRNPPAFLPVFPPPRPRARASGHRAKEPRCLRPRAGFCLRYQGAIRFFHHGKSAPQHAHGIERVQRALWRSASVRCAAFKRCCMAACSRCHRVCQPILAGAQGSTARPASVRRGGSACHQRQKPRPADSARRALLTRWQAARPARPPRALARHARDTADSASVGQRGRTRIGGSNPQSVE